MPGQGHGQPGAEAGKTYVQRPLAGWQTARANVDQEGHISSVHKMAMTDISRVTTATAPIGNLSNFASFVS